MINFQIPPVFEEPIEDTRRYCYYALAIAVIVACIYVCLIVTLDNTNLGTTNGLSKAPVISDWEHGSGTLVDSGGFLYLPVYGTLARLIPDSVVQYGGATPLPAFRKMALLNGVLGGFASGFVFFLAMRFTHSLWAAIVVLIAHAGAAFIILNSINSEDIIPAYTFFVGATVFFFEFLRSGRLWHFLASSALMALATLFHWTVMAPGLAAFGAVYAVLMTKRRIYFAAGLLWLFSFLCFLQFLILLCLPRLHIPIWAIVYPGKADAGGWVGFDVEKLIYLCVGMGNYFSGGQNFADYRIALQGVSLKMTIVSWIYAAVTLGVCLLTLLSKRASLGLKCLAVFGVVLFAAGEFGATYAQPQDPQFQIQPMLASVIGMVLLLRQVAGSADWIRYFSIGGLAVIMTINGLWNVHLFRANAGGDGLALRQIRDLDALFPKKDTVMVSQGFDGWITWQHVLLWAGDDQGFLDHSLALAWPFTTHHAISGTDAAVLITKRIDGAMARGLRVVGTDLWTEEPARFTASLTTVTTLEQARIYESIVRSHYRTGRKWMTPVGPFVELLPAGSLAR